MNVLNAHTFKKKKYLVFITTYCGLEDFRNWSHIISNSQDVQIVIIDSGNQEAVKYFNQFPIYQASKNIGCAGCWNLAANIGFNLYQTDKIFIGQDDAMFDEDMLRRIWDEANDEWLVGAYDNGFTYSLFCMTKNFWDTVGLFDENFINGSYEDNDYIHRIRVMNKHYKSLNYSSSLNKSVASKKLTNINIEKNKNYMIEKWGHFEGAFSNPFNNPDINPNECIIHSNLIAAHGNVDTFPSLIEYKSLVK